MADEKIPTPGAKFFDTRYSPAKLITFPNIPELRKESGNLVNVQTAPGGTVYGPYRLDRIVLDGQADVTWLAFADGSNARQKPLTKDELVQQLAAQAAENEAMRQKLARLEGSTPKSK